MLADAIQQGIDKGDWKPGEKLPSRRSLQDMHGLAYGTVMKALEHLEELGYVENRSREGSFVASPETRAYAARLRRNP